MGDSIERRHRGTTGISGFLATDRVPDTLFGVPVVSTEDRYLEKDLVFFREHPEAGGYYDMGDEPAAPLHGDLDPRYDTELTDEEEARYQEWRGTLPEPLRYEGDYDLRGYWKDPDTVKTAVSGDHFTDKYKKPNHPTFSRESIYAVGKDYHKAGTWDGGTFIKPETTVTNGILDHIRESEGLRLSPYKDNIGYAIGYGSHKMPDGSVVAADSPAITEAEANDMLSRDLVGRLRVMSGKTKDRARAIPGWSHMTMATRGALLDVSMGVDGALTKRKSPGLWRDLEAAGKDTDRLEAAVIKHYPSYRKVDHHDEEKRKELQSALEDRRRRGMKELFNIDFDYTGKTWTDDRGFIESPGSSR